VAVRLPAWRPLSVVDHSRISAACVVLSVALILRCLRPCSRNGKTDYECA
jgi:hypothetical protein